MIDYAKAHATKRKTAMTLLYKTFGFDVFSFSEAHTAGVYFSKGRKRTYCGRRMIWRLMTFGWIKELPSKHKRLFRLTPKGGQFINYVDYFHKFETDMAEEDL